MVNEEAMRSADGKIINIILFNGEVFCDVRCTNFYRKEDEDEENMLEKGNILINQSEIKAIEIL